MTTRLEASLEFLNTEIPRFIAAMEAWGGEGFVPIAVIDRAAETARALHWVEGALWDEEKHPDVAAAVEDAHILRDQVWYGKKRESVLDVQRRVTLIQPHLKGLHDARHTE